MEENTVIAFRSPANFQEDPLTEVLQAGAHKLLTQAIEAEVASFLEAYAALVDNAGRRRVVRNGYLPERAIQTGIGPVNLAAMWAALCVVRRSLAWLNRNRRLAKDFEATIASAEAWLFLARVQLLTRRLARA